MSTDLDAARVRIAERKRDDIARWREAHPNAEMNALLRVSLRAARATEDGEAGIGALSPAAKAQAESTWLRYQVEREVLIATGRKGTDPEVAEALGDVDERTIRRWRQSWPLAGLPPD